MNDLDFGGDLRTALHRDADLVGEPAVDLLDQLVRRRSHQRRTRVAVIGAVAAVVIIAAGIPVGASLMTRSDGGPATQTVEPTPPSVTSSAAPTTPSIEVTPSEPPVVASEAPDTQAQATSPVVDPDPPCDWTAIDAALPPDTATDTYTLYFGDGELCDGSWAAAGYTQVTTSDDGQQFANGQAGVFHYVDGSWVFVDRYADPSVCDNPAIPRDVWERGCDVD
jgi:hypothetical protein